jgi:heme exporter protein C
MKGRFFATGLIAAVLVFAGYAALFIAPDEATMHEIQRIFYFHVPVWAAMCTAFSITCIANIAWLATRQPRWDSLGVASAEVGVVCCTIGLLTGMLWGKPAWGIWWTWDPRLTTTFLLWILYISYLLLRELLEEPQKRASLSAVFGIFAFLDMPLVYVANRLWPGQHPRPVFFGDQNSGVDPAMLRVFLLCMVATIAMVMLILIDRYRLELMRHDIEELRFRAETHLADAEAATSVKGRQ